MRDWSKVRRGVFQGMAGVVIALGMAGCRHRVVVVPQPDLTVPVDTVAVPEPQEMLETPDIELPPMPVATAAASPRRERRRTTTRSGAAAPAAGGATATPAEPAADTAEEPAPAEAIGSLTAGEESSPQNLQEATSLLATNDQRLKALPDRVQRSQRAQVNRVKNFQRQAQQALRSGDSEGAKTLATKAKLLLDDLEK